MADCTLRETQQIVDNWIETVGHGYWSPHEMLARLIEEVGETARLINHLLPQGILYLSTYSRDRPDSKDSLHHPASQPIITAWEKWGTAIANGKTLHDWLRLNFFKDIHLK